MVNDGTNFESIYNDQQKLHLAKLLFTISKAMYNFFAVQKMIYSTRSINGLIH
jgi:hypothetical protein